MAPIPPALQLASRFISLLTLMIELLPFINTYGFGFKADSLKFPTAFIIYGFDKDESVIKERAYEMVFNGFKTEPPAGSSTPSLLRTSYTVKLVFEANTSATAAATLAAL